MVKFSYVHYCTFKLGETVSSILEILSNQLPNTFLLSVAHDDNQNLIEDFISHQSNSYLMSDKFVINLSAKRMKTKKFIIKSIFIGSLKCIYSHCLYTIFIKKKMLNELHLSQLYLHRISSMRHIYQSFFSNFEKTYSRLTLILYTFVIY